MKKPTQHLIAEVPRKRGHVELTIGIDLGDVWSYHCTLNQRGEVMDRGRFRTMPKAIDKWFTDVPHARVAMEAGVHSIWISEQLEQLLRRWHTSSGAAMTLAQQSRKSAAPDTQRVLSVRIREWWGASPSL